MGYIYVITAIIVIVSLFADYQKTLSGLKIAWQRFFQVIPAFLVMLIAVSILLFLLPVSTITSQLGNSSKWYGVLSASILGAVTIMPGFIAFPLCGLLLKKGLHYMLLSAFSTTLMMVGVVTYPLEKKYLGVKATLLRNVLSFIVAIIVALVTGIFYGEVL